MHVVLTILTIIGIILLVLLGILLLLLILMLFVPLRYRLHVRREKDILTADGRMTWLLHLLRADLTYTDSQGTAVIRVFGFRLKTLHFPKKDKEEEEDEDLSPARPEESTDPVRPDAIAVEDQSRTGSFSEAKRPPGMEECSGKTAPSSDDGTNHRQETAPASEQKHTRSSKPGLIEKIVSFFEKLLHFVLDLLTEVPVLPAEVHDRLEELQHKLQTKYDKVHRRIAPLFSIEAEHMLPKIIRYAQYLIRGYAPRKITGYLHFGTGSPDLTGRLTGLFYVLLPESGTEYDVDPDFYEIMLETDTTMTGQIRSYRLVWVFIRLLLDKEFRILFARVRGKEKAAKHKRARRAKRKAMLEEAEKAA